MKLDRLRKTYSFVKDVFTHSVILDATMIIKVQKETYRGVCCEVNHCTVSLLHFQYSRRVLLSGET